MKALVLALVYLMFVLSLLFAYTLFAAFILILGALSFSSNPEDTNFMIDPMSVELISPAINIRYEMQIVSIPVPWVDISVPDIIIRIFKDGILFFTRYLGIGSLIEPEFDKIEEDASLIPDDTTTGNSILNGVPARSSSVMVARKSNASTLGSINPSDLPNVIITPLESPFLVREDATGKKVHVPTSYTNNGTGIVSTVTFRMNVTIDDIDCNSSMVKAYLNVSNGMLTKGYSMVEEDLNDSSCIDGKSYNVSINFNDWTLNAVQSYKGMNLSYYFNVTYRPVNVTYVFINGSKNGFQYIFRIYENAPSIIYNPRIIQPLGSNGENHEEFEIQVILIDLELDRPALSATSNKDELYLRLWDNSSREQNMDYISQHIGFTNVSEAEAANFTNGVIYSITLTLPIGNSFWNVHYEDNFGGFVRDVYFMGNMSTCFERTLDGVLIPNSLEPNPNIIWDWTQVDDMMYWLHVPTVIMYVLFTSAVFIDPLDNGQTVPWIANLKKFLIYLSVGVGIAGVTIPFAVALANLFNPQKQEDEQISVPSQFLGIGLFSLMLSYLMFDDNPFGPQSRIQKIVSLVKFSMYAVGIGCKLVPGDFFYEKIVTWGSIFIGLTGFDVLMDGIMQRSKIYSLVKGDLENGYRILAIFFLIIGLVSIGFTVGSAIWRSTTSL